MADFPQREGDPETAVLDPFHGDIEPIPTQGCLFKIDFPDNLISRNAGMADVGAQPGVTLLWILKGESEGLSIPPKSKKMGPRGRVLENQCAVCHIYLRIETDTI